jgi:hypothetical protein
LIRKEEHIEQLGETTNKFDIQYQKIIIKNEQKKEKNIKPKVIVQKINNNVDFSQFELKEEDYSHL